MKYLILAFFLSCYQLETILPDDLSIQSIDETYLNDDIKYGQRVFDLNNTTLLKSSRQKLGIGSEGLTVNGNGYTIRRASNTLSLDDFYGLGLMPALATQAEIDNATWTTDSEGRTYTKVIRGVIYLHDFTLDCNMYNQNFGTKNVEHSGTIFIRGYNQKLPDGRVVILAFEEVIIKNVHIVNNGFADAIYFGRSYSQPNVEKVTIENITEDIESKINRKRGSITLSQTVKELNISDCNIQRLELEGGFWDGVIGDTDSARWYLNDIEVQKLDIAMFGKKLKVFAEDVTSSQMTNLYQIGGEFKNCNLAYPATSTRVNRALDLKFIDCNFICVPDINGRLAGVKIMAQYGQNSTAYFLDCNFNIKAGTNATHGKFITTDGATNTTHSANAYIDNCNFDLNWLSCGANRWAVQPISYGVVDITMDSVYHEYVWFHPFTGSQKAEVIIR